MIALRAQASALAASDERVVEPHVFDAEMAADAVAAVVADGYALEEKLVHPNRLDAAAGLLVASEAEVGKHHAPERLALRGILFIERLRAHDDGGLAVRAGVLDVRGRARAFHAEVLVPDDERLGDDELAGRQPHHAARARHGIDGRLQ